MSNITNEYFDWLVSFLDLRSSRLDFNSTIHFLKDLYNTEFRWRSPNDVNRKLDALNLREEFADDLNISYKDFEYLNDQIVNCLEVLIAFASRISDSFIEYCDSGTGTNGWFWELVKIFGLLYQKFNQSFKIFELQNEFQKGNKCSKKVTKRYQKGNKKVTNLELWYQIAHYVEDNYEIQEDPWL